MKTIINYDEESQLNLKLVIAFSRSALRLHRGTQKLVGEHCLTLAQFGVLEALYHLGDLRISEIIEKTLSTSGNMTVVVRNLEQEGLVHRLQDASDKRAFRIEITEKGRTMIANLFPQHLQQLSQNLDRLDKEEKQELIRLMKKLNGIDS